MQKSLRHRVVGIFVLIRNIEFLRHGFFKLAYCLFFCQTYVDILCSVCFCHVSLEAILKIRHNCFARQEKVRNINF